MKHKKNVPLFTSTEISKVHLRNVSLLIHFNGDLEMSSEERSSFHFFDILTLYLRNVPLFATAEIFTKHLRNVPYFYSIETVTPYLRNVPLFTSFESYIYKASKECSSCHFNENLESLFLCSL